MYADLYIYFTVLRFWSVMRSLLSFLITSFLSHSTLRRELKRVSFAESFMQGIQKVFNAGFNFLMVPSDTVFFLR